MSQEKNTVGILGIPVSNYTMAEFNRIIIDRIHCGSKCMILALNIYSANLALKNKWFFELYKKACYIHCDGDGIRLAAKLLGKQIKEKITFNQWIWELARISEEEKLSWFLIGSEQNTIEIAVSIFKKKYPNLKILGYRNGFFKLQSDIDTCVNEIKIKCPNILILGMGQPYQEKWLLKNDDKINYNIALGGGAVFEYVSGKAKITPAILVKLKLEWFYRFTKDPKRLFKRYFIGIPYFYIRLIFYKLINRPS